MSSSCAVYAALAFAWPWRMTRVTMVPMRSSTKTAAPIKIQRARPGMLVAKALTFSGRPPMVSGMFLNRRVMVPWPGGGVVLRVAGTAVRIAAGSVDSVVVSNRFSLGGCGSWETARWAVSTTLSNTPRTADGRGGTQPSLAWAFCANCSMDASSPSATRMARSITTERIMAATIGILASTSVSSWRMASKGSGFLSSKNCRWWSAT